MAQNELHSEVVSGMINVATPLARGKSCGTARNLQTMLFISGVVAVLVDRVHAPKYCATRNPGNADRKQA